MTNTKINEGNLRQEHNIYLENPNGEKPQSEAEDIIISKFKEYKL